MKNNDKIYLAVTVVMLAGILAPYPLTTIPAVLASFVLTEGLK